MKRKWVLIFLMFLTHSCIANSPTTKPPPTEGLLPTKTSAIEDGETSPVPTPLTVWPTSTELQEPTKIPVPQKGESPSLPTPTITITPYVLDFIQYQRLEILPELPPVTSVSGRLVVAADPDYILTLPLRPNKVSRTFIFVSRLRPMDSGWPIVSLRINNLWWKMCMGTSWHNSR